MGWINIPLGGGVVYEVGDPRDAVSGAIDGWVADRARQAGRAATEESVRTLSEAATSGELDEAARAIGARAGEEAREEVGEEITTRLLLGGLAALLVAGAGYIGWRAAKRR